MELLQQNYCSSDSDGDSDIERNVDGDSDSYSGKCKKQLPLPPVPSQVLDKFYVAPNVDKYSPTTEMSFTRGMWNNFVFIELRPNSEQRNSLNKLLTVFNEKLQLLETPKPIVQFQPLHITQLGSPLPLHISLSSNIQFSTKKEADMFVKMLSVEILQKFPIKFTFKFKPELQIYDNFNHSALFLTLDVSHEIKTRYLSKLSSIVQESIDCVCVEEKSPELEQWSYRNAHMSIGKSANSYITEQYLMQKDMSDEETAKKAYYQRVQELNDIVQSIPVDRATTQSFEFECRGIKVTKQRENIWIPFSK